MKEEAGRRIERKKGPGQWMGKGGENRLMEKWEEKRSKRRRKEKGEGEEKRV